MRKCFRRQPGICRKPATRAALEDIAGAFFALHAKEAYGFQRKGMAQMEAKEGKGKGNVSVKQSDPSGTVISDTKIRPSEAVREKIWNFKRGQPECKVCRSQRHTEGDHKRTGCPPLGSVT